MHQNQGVTMKTIQCYYAGRVTKSDGKYAHIFLPINESYESENRLTFSGTRHDIIGQLFELTTEDGAKYSFKKLDGKFLEDKALLQEAVIRDESAQDSFIHHRQVKMIEKTFAANVDIGRMTLNQLKELYKKQKWSNEYIVDAIKNYLRRS
jgi:hypothetical protein